MTATSTEPLEAPPRSSPVSPARSRPLRKTARTRLKLVEAIRSELEQAGGFTAEQAARRAGASPATFYNHFGSKDDALGAAFAALMDDLVALVETHLRVDRLLELGVAGFAEAWVLETAGFFRANSRTFAAARMQMPTSKPLRAIYREGETQALALYERFVRLGQTARVLRAGDPGPIALAFMISNQGWNHPTVLRMQPGDALHRELAGAVVSQLGCGPDATQAGASPASRTSPAADDPREDSDA